MAEITRIGLFELFVGKQTLGNIDLNDGDIKFDVFVPDPDSETEKKFVSHGIKRSDLEDIEGFFTDYLQSQPFVQHLLQILWIREVKFGMGPLEKDGMYDFLCKVLDLCGFMIDEEGVKNELIELSKEGYLQETASMFFLTSRGKYAAEGMLRAMGMPTPDRVESPSIAVRGDTVVEAIREEEFLQQPVPVRDKGIAGDMLWALQISTLPDEKIRRWTLWKSGMRYIEIAKSEKPDYEEKYGSEKAKKFWERNANTIEKQVKSVEKMIEKRKWFYCPFFLPPLGGFFMRCQPDKNRKSF